MDKPFVPLTARWLAFVLISLALTGCAGASIYLSHEPMHPGTSQSVTVSALSNGTVDRIVIEYESYTLSTAANGTHTQTVAQARTTVETCDPSGTVSTLTCTHTFNSGFPASSLVKIFATAYGNKGSVSESYSFAAGTYPWPNDPIPIRTAGQPASSFDTVFIRDTDITAANFMANLDEVVEDLYFKYNIIRTWRGLYNFYYSTTSGNYEELCAFTNPSNMSTLQLTGDSIVFLHQTDLRDCRSGKRISSEIDYDKSLIHESGHILFNLQDEYCCDSSYSPQACYPNLWSSESACQAYAPNLSMTPSACTQLSKSGTTLNYWYIDPAGTNGCMMGTGQHNAGSDFGPACQKRIYFKYGKCINGNCFPQPECP